MFVRSHGWSQWPWLDFQKGAETCLGQFTQILVVARMSDEDEVLAQSDHTRVRWKALDELESM